MNIVAIIGRLTKDPDMRYTTGDSPMAVSRYTLAVDRFGKDADFIPCIAFGKTAEFSGKYLHKGTKVGITGSIQTGKYVDGNGKTVYTWNVVVDRHDFAEAPTLEATKKPEEKKDEGFLEIPIGIDEELPFI